MAWQYSDKTVKLFMDAVHGKPGTHMGEIEEPDGLGEHGSISCGDALRFTFRVKKHPEDPVQDRIVEARYLTFGCTSAIAASEAICIMIEEKKCSPIEALTITNEDIVEFLEGLPDQKIHCSVLGAEALEAAVFNWAQKRGVDTELLGLAPHSEEEEEGRIVCKCFSVTEPYLRRKIKELNLRNIPEITNAIKAGGACMSCHHAPGGLQDILNDTWGEKGTTLIENPEALSQNASGKDIEMSTFQLIKKIEQLMNDYVRPMLQRDGGDIEIVDIKGNIVYCKLVGACSDCAGAQMTLKMLVEKSLKDQVDEHLRVIAV